MLINQRRSACMSTVAAVTHPSLSTFVTFALYYGCKRTKYLVPNDRDEDPTRALSYGDGNG